MLAVTEHHTVMGSLLRGGNMCICHHFIEEWDRVGLCDRLQLLDAVRTVS